MNLRFNTSLAEGYKSASQIAHLSSRVLRRVGYLDNKTQKPLRLHVHYNKMPF